MRGPLIAVIVSALGSQALAQPLQITGKFGYLGEYELSANLTADSGARDYAGPLIVKHVGLCSHDGPPQMSGEITLHRTDAAAPVRATLLFDGRRCTFSGPLSETAVGELVCPGAAVPASLWPRGE
jgi:hypothetical protein